MRDQKSFDAVDRQPGTKSVFGPRDAVAATGERYGGPERRHGLPNRRLSSDRRDSIRMLDDRRRGGGRRKSDRDVWAEPHRTR